MDTQDSDNRPLTRQTLVLHLMPEALLDGLTSRLEQAGLGGGSGGQTLEWLAIGGALLGLGVAGLMSAAGGPPFGLSLPGVALLLALTAALGVPAYWLARRTERQQARLSRQIPQVLDLLVVALETGHSLDSAMQQVTRVFQGPLVVELERVLARMLEGVPLAAALDEMTTRSGLPELEAISSSVAASRQMGTPLASSLRSQASQLRQKRAVAAEETARKASVKILLPLATCIFPVLLTLLLGPAAIGIFSVFSKLNLPK